MLHKISFPKEFKKLLYTQKQQQSGKSHIRAEFQLYHPVVQSTATYLKKKTLHNSHSLSEQFMLM